MTTISSQAKAFETSIGILDDKRLVFLYQLDEEGDTGIDIVLVAAECLIQHLKPGIADLAIGRNADPPLSISD